MTKILLADDSVTIQKVVELTFSDEESRVITAGDGVTALERIRSDRPDIILSDVNMPGMNGYELCQQVKTDSDLGSIPFLFLKGTFESFDEDKARQCGADGFMVKPFESQELIRKVKELVEKSGAAAPPPPGCSCCRGDIRPASDPRPAVPGPFVPAAQPGGRR
ncbi:response regulator [bacterium]|nr:response regulator [bacterium]